jgi:hypothetical protein
MAPASAGGFRPEVHEIVKNPRNTRRFGHFSPPARALR